MPRYSRKKCESGIFHVMLRGINKQTIFEDDEDKERIIETIARYKEISKYEVYGYCLMSNHIHLLIKETEEPISAIMKRICSSYVYWYNWKYDRCGHLFQERYKSEVVEDDGYLLTVLRYIHQNPVKAGLQKDVKGYKWSSYDEYITKPGLVNKRFVLDLFSVDSEKAIKLFVEHMNMQSVDKCLEFDEKHRLSDDELKEYLLNTGFQSPNDLQQMERSKRNKIIRELKAIEGVTMRQLSRITGIPKSVVGRA